MKNEEYKKGDKLICIPGFKDLSGEEGGSGYKDGRIFTVRRVSNREDLDAAIYWPEEETPNAHGIYGRACKLYKAEEVTNMYPLY